MQPIEKLRTRPGLRGLLFDLDDTFLSSGRLTVPALTALYDLKQSGFTLIGVTGRPAGLGRFLIDQWPIDAMITENGGIQFVKPPAGPARCQDALPEAERSQRRAHLLRVAARLQQRFTDLRVSNDCEARRTDYTFDIGEHHQLSPARVAEVAQAAVLAGVRVTVSSIHLHISLDATDKAVACVQLLSEHFGEDPTACRFRYAYIGDSSNDAPCFAAFHHSVAVANLSGKPSIMPRYQTRGAQSEGFCELAQLLVAIRTNGGPQD